MEVRDRKWRAKILENQTRFFGRQKEGGEVPQSGRTRRLNQTPLRVNAKGEENPGQEGL